jgi:hypothetical protein
MQKNGLVYLIHTYIYKLRKSLLKEQLKNICKIVDGFINNAYLLSRQNIYINEYLHGDGDAPDLAAQLDAHLHGDLGEDGLGLGAVVEVEVVGGDDLGGHGPLHAARPLDRVVHVLVGVGHDAHEHLRAARAVVVACNASTFLKVSIFKIDSKFVLYSNGVCFFIRIYMFQSILEFEQSWNFFHQLYNYSKKIL